MRYAASEGTAIPSLSRQDPGLVSRLRKQHERVYNPGNGWVYVSTTSRLFLILENGKEIDVAPFFKEKWGRLTAGRRDAIAETMPTEIEMSATVDVSVLECWLERAKKADTPKKKVLRSVQKAAQEAQLEVELAERLATLARQLEQEREQEIASAPKFSFKLGFNKKHQRDQWVHRAQNQKLYVLRQEDTYSPSDGCVPVRIVRELVPAKIYLVSRLNIA